LESCANIRNNQYISIQGNLLEALISSGTTSDWVNNFWQKFFMRLKKGLSLLAQIMKLVSKWPRPIQSMFFTGFLGVPES
jgi:hypothetical protein